MLVLAPLQICLVFRLSQDSNLFPNSTSYYNIFKFLAYHRVYDDWYRNPNLSRPVFTQPVGPSAITLSNLPYTASQSVLNFDLDSYVFGWDASLFVPSA